MTTDGNGVADVTLVDHPYQYASGNWGNTALPETSGQVNIQTYTGRYTMQTGQANTARYGGYVPTIDNAGIMSYVILFSGYGGDGTLWNNASQISGTFNAPSEYGTVF